MALKRRTGSAKSPPILSHEFVIQNHADIVSFVAMLIVVGLLFQMTSSLASNFVAIQHNSTEPVVTPYGTFVSYTTGPKDVAIIAFYFLISIVIHAVIQEYLLDKISRKLHLSKTKHSKFNESGQLLVFLLVSLIWACEIIRREGLLYSISRIWSDYPARHVEMSYLLKFYFVIQIAYWAHTFPELYFQKVKKDEMGPRVTYGTLYLIFTLAAYLANFTRFAVVLSVLHYTAEVLFHLSRLLYFSTKTKVVKYTFNVWNVVFVLSRLASITLTVLTFWYGLAVTSTPTFNLVTGNFNTPLVRLTALVGIGLLQAWMMWNFITFHLRRRREKAAEIARRKKNQAAKLQQTTSTKGHRSDLSDSEVNELPEVDQQEAISASQSPKSKKSSTLGGKVGGQKLKIK